MTAATTFQAADEEIAPIAVMRRDIIRALKSRAITVDEARYIYDLYYDIQRERIALGNKIAAMRKVDEPTLLVEHYHAEFEVLEAHCLKVLEKWVKSSLSGRWLLSLHGIGPSLAAGLLAFVRPEYCSSAGKIWRFAGLDPSATDKKYNRRFKRLCWLVGEQIAMRAKHPENYYGKVYLKRKEYETERNERGDYADQAAEALRKFNYDKSTAAYQSYIAGKLPAARIDQRARRYAVKLLLAHLAQVVWEATYEKPQPLPYPIAHMGHDDFIPPPNWRSILGTPAVKAERGPVTVSARAVGLVK